MKKLLLSVFAIAALASCAQDEILGVAKGDAIVFENAFVDNTTKAIDPSITTASIDTFQVWGTTQGDHTNAAIVPIFANVEVEKTDGVWGYANNLIQYWIDGNKYNFAAVVNGTVASLVNGLPETISYNLATVGNYEDKDLLYATAGPIEGKASGNDEVGFTFSHLLSKAVFTFTNTSADKTKNVYVVKDIIINNCIWNGIYTVSSQEWAAGGDKMGIKFGHIVAAGTAADEAAAPVTTTPLKSNYERLLIPVASQDVVIDCTIELYLNGEVKPENLADVIYYSRPYTLNLEAGKYYNFALSAGLNDPIKFKVDLVEGWTDGADPTLDKPNHDNTPEQNN